MKKKFLITATLLVGAYFLQSCGNVGGDKSKTVMDSSMSYTAQDDSMSGGMQMNTDMMSTMKDMKGKMSEITMTGDFDLDFASMMILHHRAAIDMGNIEIAKGADATIKAIAQSIVSGQNAEIEQMQQFIKNYTKPATKQDTAKMKNALSTSMEAMMEKMNSMQMTGNTDKDFVMMMIPHHEGAITMAKDELSNGKSPELKKMAKKMIDDQTKEIDTFKAWLTAHM